MEKRYIWKYMVMKHKEYIIVLTPKWLIFILKSIPLETFSVLNSNKKNELMETILKFKNFDNISKFRFHWVIHSRVNKELISLLNFVLLYSNMNGSMRSWLRKIFKIASYNFFYIFEFSTKNDFYWYRFQYKKKTLSSIELLPDIIQSLLMNLFVIWSGI